ncbi:MAG: hypothetical protein PHW73_01055 [Atribacterota bacterium]|nr:hypothetical protein [Atribacterota bacterium]
MIKYLILIFFGMILLFGNSSNSDNCFAGFLSDTIKFHDNTWLKNSHSGTKDMFIVNIQHPYLEDSLKIDSISHKRLAIIDNNYCSILNYTYQWSSGEIVRSATINSPGWYKVTITKNAVNYLTGKNFGEANIYHIQTAIDSIEIISKNYPFKTGSKPLIINGKIMLNRVYEKK